jgi:hypothetical protein
LQRGTNGKHVPTGASYLGIWVICGVDFGLHSAKMIAKAEEFGKGLTEN